MRSIFLACLALACGSQEGTELASKFQIGKCEIILLTEDIQVSCAEKTSLRVQLKSLRPLVESFLRDGVLPNSNEIFGLPLVGVVGQSELVEKRFCVSRAEAHPEWGSGGGHVAFFENLGRFAFENNDEGFFEEYEDDSASLEGILTHEDYPSYQLRMQASFFVEGFEAPEDSPKKELKDGAYKKKGGPVDTDTFKYYESFIALFYGIGALEGLVLEVVRTGPAFQMGVGANNKNVNLGGSGWYTVKRLDDGPESLMKSPQEREKNHKKDDENHDEKDHKKDDKSHDEKDHSKHEKDYSLFLLGDSKKKEESKEEIKGDFNFDMKECPVIEVPDPETDSEPEPEPDPEPNPEPLPEVQSPLPFEILSPKGEQILNTPTLKWQSSDFAKSYKVALYTMAECQGEAVQSWEDVVEVEVVSTALEAGTYFVCVWALNESKETEASNNGLRFFILPKGVYFHRAFLSSTTFAIDGRPDFPPDFPNFGNLDAADWSCNLLASLDGRIPEWDGLSILYRAVASIAGADARFRIPILGPIYGSDGQLIAADEDTFFSGSLNSSLNSTEEGVFPEDPTIPVLTGTDSFGFWSGAACNGLSNANGLGTFGDSQKIDQGWLSSEPFGACNQPFRLYCISP